MSRRGRRGRGGAAPYAVMGQPPRQEAPRGPIEVHRGASLDLGDFSAEAATRPPLVADFGYFGARIRVNPDLTEIDIIDFLDDAERIDANDPRSMIMIKAACKAHIHPEDFDTFWRLRKENRQGLNDIMPVIWQIVAGVTNRPTGQPSDSSAGLPNTRPNSPVTSPEPDTDPRRTAYLRQIERLEAMGPNGVAMAAQLATSAEAQGVDITRQHGGLSLVRTA